MVRRKDLFLFSFGFPKNQGLYDSRFEKDSCGIGMVAHLKGLKSHDIVKDALEVLMRQHHRGAQGVDPNTGDGAGILLQIPHDFFSELLGRDGIKLPQPGTYGVGMVFLPSNSGQRKKLQNIFESFIFSEGASLLGWREVEVNSSVLGDSARSTQPKIYQIFISSLDSDQQSLERRLYLIRKQVEKAVLLSQLDSRGQFCIPSLSTQTIVYKGLLLPCQVGEFYQDLKDPLFTSALAIVHSRFSTNTFPTWSLAHPYRYLCHNGEINTVKGNVNWMKARQGSLLPRDETKDDDLKKIYPIITENQSDSACLDNALEFLVQNGRSLAHSMMMLMPEPWAPGLPMNDDLRGFYEFHSSIMEPWDGPAAVCFTDGTVVGTISDRNGLRPCRYQVTTDDKVILASEAGVLPLDTSLIREKGRLGPGQIFLVDTGKGCIINNAEAKAEISKQKSYADWARHGRISLDEIPTPPVSLENERSLTLPQLQRLSGLAREEIKRILLPMALKGEEPTSSMGNDIPLAVLSSRPQLLFNYFRQMFAQVTNPPIDPIRERLVMSLEVRLGPKHPLLSEERDPFKNIILNSPVLSSLDIGKIRLYSNPEFRIKTVPAIFESRTGENQNTARTLLRGLSILCRSAKTAIEAGCKILIISDREIDANWAPIPSLLAVSTLHQYLIRKALRTQVSLIVESSEPWSTHHFGCLLGYGAEAIHPYVALESVQELGPKATEANYLQAVNKAFSRSSQKWEFPRFNLIAVPKFLKLLA
ncbi:MAG: glutamate synthase central domain-containing protein [Bdellovibrionia bacterium]